MHSTQTRILNLAKSQNIGLLTLRELGTQIGIGEKPAIVQHHLTQLERKGFLRIDHKAKKVEILSDKSDERLVRVPVLGSANCGEALSYPDDYAESYLSLSRTVLKNMNGKVVAAFRAVGDSMNKARILTTNGMKVGIDEGDYVLVSASDLSEDLFGRYVLSSIDGMANIKKLVKSEFGISLESESTKGYPPIYIDASEQSYFVQGRVVGVIKQ